MNDPLKLGRATLTIGDILYVREEEVVDSQDFDSLSSLLKFTERDKKVEMTRRAWAKLEQMIYE